ncbi:MAG: hypothetical protein JO069_03840 [Verrucomicrobia bacterium]|nr:hypothetical protein [Verrucomicrobiota bacterium]
MASSNAPTRSGRTTRRTSRGDPGPGRRIRGPGGAEAPILPTAKDDPIEPMLATHPMLPMLPIEPMLPMDPMLPIEPMDPIEPMLPSDPRAARLPSEPMLRRLAIAPLLREEGAGRRGQRKAGKTEGCIPGIQRTYAGGASSPLGNAAAQGGRNPFPCFRVHL